MNEIDLNKLINLNHFKGVCYGALRKWGASHQLLKSKEELLELLTELNNLDLGVAHVDEIVDEIVDVFITTGQLACLMGLDKVLSRFEYKLTRLDKLITGPGSVSVPSKTECQDL